MSAWIAKSYDGNKTITWERGEERNGTQIIESRRVEYPLSQIADGVFYHDDGHELNPA